MGMKRTLCVRMRVSRAAGGRDSVRSRLCLTVESISSLSMRRSSATNAVGGPLRSSCPESRADTKCEARTSEHHTTRTSSAKCARLVVRAARCSAPLRLCLPIWTVAVRYKQQVCRAGVSMRRELARGFEDDALGRRIDVLEPRSRSARHRRWYETCDLRASARSLPCVQLARRRNRLYSSRGYGRWDARTPRRRPRRWERGARTRTETASPSGCRADGCRSATVRP